MQRAGATRPFDLSRVRVVGVYSQARRLAAGGAEFPAALVRCDTGVWYAGMTLHVPGEDVIEDLGYPEEEPWFDDDDELADGLAEDESVEYELSDEDAEFVHEITSRIIVFCEELWGKELRPYQRQMAYRIIESMITGEADEITALWARQSGKSETLAVVLSGCMVVLPKLAKTFPMLKRFKDGVMVGVFAPVEDQSEIVFSRIVSRLTSDRAMAILSDPEIDEWPDGKSKILKLKSGSFVRRQTASPRAKIEGGSYHIIVIDESQDADELVVRKSIHPMLAAFAGTIVKIGTPSYTKGDFYKAINLNKRMGARNRAKQDHFEFDWKVVAKYNPDYGKFIAKEKMRLGEDSEEFQMSYCLKWMLERGMLVTEDQLDSLGDTSMPLQKSWHMTEVVVGIDPARVKDSTVVTVCWVDWDYPDPAGYREHRILNWLEIHNTDWESQYFEIVEFLRPYRLRAIAVDAQGMGSAVADRLKHLFAGVCPVVAFTSDSKNQADRWAYLIQLIQRNLMIYPSHSKARRTRVWRRFRQQMTDVERVMKGQYMLVQAPENEREAHDDYVDSLALACALTMNTQETGVVEQFNSPFYSRR